MSSASNTIGTIITVTFFGTNVPLPDNQQLNNMSINGANDTFTIEQSGMYELEYHIYLTNPATSTYSRLECNGAPLVDSEFTPVIGTDHLTKKVTVNLNAGDTLSLQVYNYLGPVTLVNGDPSKVTSLSITKK